MSALADATIIIDSVAPWTRIDRLALGQRWLGAISVVDVGIDDALRELAVDQIEL